jgi:DegV family protein with EDD domain
MRIEGMAVKVVTDSTADLPPELARRFGIEVVPLYVHFGEETRRDRVDIGPDEFYQKLVQSQQLPTTSAPSPGVLQEVYFRHLKESEGIISIHISSKLSATHNSALLAREQVRGKIEVIDSLTCSMALGLLALAAARMAREGMGFQELAREVKTMLPRAYVFGLLDTLDYLVKGGRIGKARALVGSLLNIKPLLTVKAGEAHDLARVRTRARAIDKLCQIVESFRSIQAMAVLSTTTPQEAEGLAQRLGAHYQEEIHMARFGPVMGTYTGPGALGIAVLGESPF